MAGSRTEWTRDRTRARGENPALYFARGANFADEPERKSRLAGRYYLNPLVAGGSLGFRLVARPRK